MPKTYLVTGGAGFIGSNLIELLIRQNINIICVDNFDPFYAREIKEDNLKTVLTSPLFTLVEADIRNKEEMVSVFKKNTIDLVIHLAAKTGVRPSIINSQEYFDVNVNGTLVLLEVMKEYNVKKMVFASSSSVYGNNEKIPYSETDNVDNPISPYAASKKSCELLTFNFHHLYHIDVINLRFFTVYGPRQRPDLAIHKFFKSLNNNKPIDLYGDGSTSRDYTFVMDTVAGIVKATEYVLEHNDVYEVINIGNHTPVKLSVLIEMIEDTTGKKFIYNRMPLQQGDAQITYADISKAQKLLDFKPATTLKTGLLEFKKWFER